MADKLTLASRVLALEGQVSKAKWIIGIAGAFLVAFGGFTYQGIPERARLAVDDKTSTEARRAILSYRDSAEKAAAQAAQEAGAIAGLREQIADSANLEIIRVAVDRAGESAASRSTSFVKKDLCFLVEVGSYGRTTKSCVLKQTEMGWQLTAHARNANASCGAACLNLLGGSRLDSGN